ncbi:MAG: enoyl-CoA hydratase/isomerase family protein [Deltaproteobacteria bacterium]|nr:enoyl-CoA hydratase/isomerase family protein [Deltaproteobacteria bacterium]
MRTFKTLVLEERGEALWIFFNRSEVKNAFSLSMAEEFLEAVRWGLKDEKFAVIVLSGKGTDFSAGGDIRKMKETKNRKKFFLQISKIIHTAVMKMRKGEKPIIAAIPGYVGGIAFGLVLGADFRIVTTEAQLNAATIRLGLVANGGATYYLPRMVGMTRASEILLLGEILSAKEALAMGLVNWVVPPENLESETQKIVEKLAAQPRKALGRLKKILNESLKSSLLAQLKKERQSIAWSATTPDFEEGVSAFLEKRRPQFNQKIS